MSEKLLPCPFCGHENPEFERMGDRRQSCIVICGWCGARHESSDEGECCGSSWNQRAEPGQDGLRTTLETALNRIEDMLAGDDGQAFKEARKFLPVGRAALAAQPGVVPDLYERIAQAHDASLDDDHRACRSMLMEVLRLMVKTDSLKALRASIRGDYYMGEDWEQETIDAMLSACPSAPTAVEPTYPMATTLESAAQDVAKWLNERPNSPLDLRHVAMLVHAVQASAAAVEPDERSMFEAWYSPQCHPNNMRRVEGRYWEPSIEKMWQAWQARASKGTTL